MQLQLIQQVKLSVCMLCNSLYTYTKNKEMKQMLHVAPQNCRDCMRDNKHCHTELVVSSARRAASKCKVNFWT